MHMLLHALFPKDLDGEARRALHELKDAAIADPSFEHVCAYDALALTPSGDRSAIGPFAVAGVIGFGTLGLVTGAVGGLLDIGQLPTQTSALLGMLGFGALGGFASVLGGIGAPEPGLSSAAKNLKPGRMLMTFALNESARAPEAERILQRFGALEIHRQLR